MARTFHDRPAHLQYEERPWLTPFLKGGSRTWLQRAAHKRDRAALKRALRTGSDRPAPSTAASTGTRTESAPKKRPRLPAGPFAFSTRTARPTPP
ncbi:hypothetical protein AB0F96_38705 [Streptomyces sp. NPDC023998]|uniref:hypothetical protein n=1 Tax=Streptomyces sp. NPDC023998 TaxID=3154597 RepID=UPI00340294A3